MNIIFLILQFFMAVQVEQTFCQSTQDEFTQCSIPQVANGTVIYKAAIIGNGKMVPAGSMIYLNCNQGFIGFGTFVTTCLSNGTLSAPLGGCYKLVLPMQPTLETTPEGTTTVDCKAPEVAKGSIVYKGSSMEAGKSIPSGALVFLRCNQGFASFGPMCTTCLDNGQLQADLGTCFFAAPFAPSSNRPKSSTSAPASSNNIARQIQLMEAAANCDLTKTKELLQLSPKIIDINWQDPSYKPGCSWAALRNHSALIMATVCNCSAILVKALIDAGARLDVTDNYGDAPLRYATANNNLDMVKLLISRGANRSAVNTAGMSALTFATAQRNLFIASALLLQSPSNTIAQPPSINGSQMHLLEAVGQCDLKRVGELLRIPSVDVNWRDPTRRFLCGWLYMQNYPALSKATACSCGAPLIKLLIDAGGNVNNLDATGSTPLVYSFMLANAGVSTLLLENGADLGVMERQQ